MTEINPTDFVAVTVGVSIVLGSVVSVVYCISHKTSYKYCDDTFMRKDLHSQEYKTLLEKIKEIKTDVEEIKNKA